MTAAATAEVAPPTDVAEAESAGQVMKLGDFDMADAPLLGHIIEDAPGPTLLLSDKPEYFRTGDGIAMREPITAGDYRLYMYHVPTPDAGEKYISAVVDNTSKQPVTLTFRKSILPTPGGDYHLIGKLGMAELFDDESDALAPLTVEPGTAVLLDERHLTLPLKTNDLIHGIYDFTSDGPVTINVLQTSPNQNPAIWFHKLPHLPQVLEGHHPSGAGRGKFDVATKTVSLREPWDTASGRAQVIFADGDDDWITGTDGMTGDATVNKGNYGVVYHVRLSYTSSDGRGVALVTYNPRAAARWCSFQAVAVDLVTPGLLRRAGGALSLPATRTRYGAPPEVVVIEHFPRAAEGESGTIELRFTPPGASCLPVPFVLVPLEPDSRPDGRQKAGK